MTPEPVTGKPPTGHVGTAEPPTSPESSRNLTRGERVIAFIERFCIVPEGKNVGQLMRLEDFQRDFILDVYDNPHGTNSAILSIAKKNGKTGLIACIVLAHVVGPEAIQNSQVVSGAMTREQASLVFDYCAKMVRLSPVLSRAIRIVGGRKRLYGLMRNVEFRALASVAKSTHGISPAVAILDEVGQVRGPKSDFVDAITTAQGAYDDAIMFVISTQAANDADLLSVMIDDAQTGEDVHTVCHVHAAPKECEVSDRAAWRAANPALGKFRSLPDMEKLADKARRMPSFTPTFRNLNLNQRVETHSPFVTREIWDMGNGDVVPHDGADVYASIDLSAVADLTALTAVWFAGGRWNVTCRFWAPEGGLMDRVRRDKAPYDVWAQQGILTLCPGNTVDYDFVAADFLEMAADWNLKDVAFDRWRIEMFKASLMRQECERATLEKFKGFGQGFVSMSPALDALERVLLDAKLRHGGNALLRMCASNAVVVKDRGGASRKFDKRSAFRRIDGMVTLAMCMARATANTPVDTGMSIFTMG